MWAAQERRAARRRGARGPYRWTDEELEAALHEFTRGRDTFPTLAEFDSERRTDLRCAVVDLGGVAYWAERIGLPVPASRQRMAYTLDDAVRDARQVVDLAGRLPGEPVLRAMGYARLATVVRNAGGAARFASEHGLPH